MAKSGYIKTIQYNVLGGAVGSTWYTLGVIPPAVSLNTSFALAVTWENTGDEAFDGHIALSVTDPNGIVSVITAASGQDANVLAGGETAVVFTAFTLDVAGVYAAEMTLTEEDHTTVYDTNASQVAIVAADAADAIGIDITELMNLMITMMIVMMMMKMMSGMITKA